MATNINLPDPETFTREELAKRWNCDISLIDNYIKNGQLKEGFNTFGEEYNYLRELLYFTCSDNKNILGLITEINEIAYYSHNKKKQRELFNSKTIDCPKYLYISVFNPKDIVKPRSLADTMKPSVFNFIEKMFLLNDRDDLIIRFCDLENNTLFPMTADGYEVISVKKPKQEDLIIPLEEVLRFEKKHGIREEDVSRAITKKVEKKQEDTDTPSQEPNDNAAGDNKHSSAPEERIIRMKDVVKRVGISRPHIYKLMDEGQFPKSVKLTGNRAVGWYESVIDKWIKDRDEQRRKDGEEADE